MAIIDQTIQSGITVVSTSLGAHNSCVRGSDGTLYTIYRKTSSGVLFSAYSTDGGLTWSEASSGSTIDATIPGLDLAISSDDILHVVYVKDSDNLGYYKQFTITGGWTTEEKFSGTSIIVARPCVAIDSVDNVHVAYQDNGGVIVYNKRTTGTWGTILTINAVVNNGSPQIAIDSNNYIYVVFIGGNNARIDYVKYTSFWTAAVQIGATNVNANSLPSITITSIDDVYVVYQTNSNTRTYVKYTAATDTWGAQVSSAPASYSFPISVAVDSSDNINVLYADQSSPADIFFEQNWGGGTKILDASGSDAFTKPQIQSTVWPLIGGVHTNIPTAGYQFTYINTVAGVNILRFYSSTDIDFPAPQTENYSREASGSLPVTDSNLSSLFTSAEYTEVATVNDVFATQTATDQYSIFEFKNKGNAVTDNIVVTWIGQSNIAPTTSTVYLQIYNRNSATWETLASNGSAGANANFSLSGTKTSSLTNYYDGSLWVSCRVYQLAA